ncbi:hypothetical protein EFL89_07445 [Lactococcus lactis]|nr:hypothetical protein [Lactococcus lactis]
MKRSNNSYKAFLLLDRMEKYDSAIITTLMTRLVRCCMSCVGLSWWVKKRRKHETIGLLK